jgi:two-component system KDP operon response regulator KdpE
MSAVSAQGKLLIIDTWPDSARELHQSLYAAGFSVTDATGVNQAIALCAVIEFDAIVLSRDPDESRACEVLRRTVPEAAMLVIGNTDDPEGRIAILEAGADDYLVIPVHIGELIARIRAVLRRSRNQTEVHSEQIAIGEIRLYPRRRLVFKGDQTIHLSPKEFRVLHYLMLHSGRPVSHAALLTAIWGPEHAAEVSYLRTLMRQLRVKLEDGDPPRYLVTDTHVGYRFNGPENATDRPG